MRKLRQWLLISLLTLTGAGSAISVSVSAQQADESDLYRDNQTRAARLSYVKGAVHIDGVGDPLDGVVNMPIVEGQRVSTGDDGEAEIEFEDGSMLRLTPNSAAELNQMTGDQSGNMSTALGLLGGVYYMDLRASDQTHFIVDAADERIEPRENSVIRVRMDDPPAEISLFEGAATVSRQGGFSAEVNSGESIRGDSHSAGRYYLSQQIDQDSWDQWNEDREQQAANDANLRTDAQLSSGDTSGYGWSDLDAYGNWYDIPGEGQVWQPEQAADPNFDPYGYGNWVYYPTSGYVWVSSYPWGWKPFRCGYWNYIGGFGWGWQPTGCGVRAWGGFGGSGGFSIRIRNYPRGYRPPIRPMPGRGSGWSGGRPPRRVIPIGTRPPISPRIPNREGRPVNFGGRTYQPLPRRGGYTQRGGSAVGSGFRRDFPVNRDHRPEIGRPATQPGTAIVPGPGWRAVDNGRARNGQNRGSQIAPQNSQPVPADNRRPQYGNGDWRNRNGQQPNPVAGDGQPANNGQGNRQPVGNAVPGANPPVRRNDEGGPLTVRRPDGSVIQPGENAQGDNNFPRRRRGDYNGRPATQPGAPAPGGVGIPAQPAAQQPGSPTPANQQPGSAVDPRRQLTDEQRQQQIQQRQQRMEQWRQQQMQQPGGPNRQQPTGEQGQPQQNIDQQRLQQQRQQQIEQMRQQMQQRQQQEGQRLDQQRQQQMQQMRDQQRQQQEQQQRQVQDQQRQQMDQQRRMQEQQQQQLRHQQMQQMRQQQEQLRQQQSEQQRQQMREQIQQRQQQMEQMRQQRQQQQPPASRPAPAAPAPQK